MKRTRMNWNEGFRFFVASPQDRQLSYFLHLTTLYNPPVIGNKDHEINKSFDNRNEND